MRAGIGDRRIADVPDTRAGIDARLAALEGAGIARSRLVLDPGMGFFLGTDPETSLEALRRLPELKVRYGLPVLVSVTRKSFIRRLVGRDDRGLGLRAERTCVSGAPIALRHERRRTISPHQGQRPEAGPR